MLQALIDELNAMRKGDAEAMSAAIQDMDMDIQRLVEAKEALEAALAKRNEPGTFDLGNLVQLNRVYAQELGDSKVEKINDTVVPTEPGQRWMFQWSVGRVVECYDRGGQKRLVEFGDGASRFEMWIDSALLVKV
jgi:hypothetical protein